MKMKSIILCMAVVLTWDPVLKAEESPKPFHKVLVLAGGGLDTAVPLGVIDGLRQEGWNPDLIITTCGSSISGVILKAKGSLDGARDFLNTDDFRNLVHSVKFKQSFVPAILERIFFDSNDRVPHIFKNTVMAVPTQWPREARDQDLIKKFPRPDLRGQEGPALVVISGHTYYAPKYLNSTINDRKLIREALLTDEKTAYILGQNLKGSFIAAAYPESHLDPNIEIRSDLNLFEAARASISDPYLINPFPGPQNSNDITDIFLTGGVDLFPIDMAQQLGDEVIALYGGSYSSIENRAVENTFGYNPQKRLVEMTKRKIRAWIDMSDDDRWDQQIGFDPVLRWLSLMNNIPKSVGRFLERNQQQWEFGVQRAREAMALPANDQSHIREKAKP